MLLARYTYSAKPKLWTPPPAEARHLKSLLSRLDALQEDLQRELNRLKNTKVTDTAPIVKASIKQMTVSLQAAIRNYNALDVSGFKYLRINHSKEFTCGQNNHINSIENFWNQFKRTLRKYKGMDKKHFHLFLKECEFRFNYSFTVSSACRLVGAEKMV